MPRPDDEADADEALVCKYDAWNRLKKVYKDKGSVAHEIDGTDTLVVTYEYDGIHRRIRKVFPALQAIPRGGTGVSPVGGTAVAGAIPIDPVPVTRNHKYY